MPEPPSPQRIDLVHRQHHFANTLPDLRLFRERFFRACRTRLFQTLRRNVQVEDDHSATLLHDEYLNTAHDGPCLYTIYAIPPLRGLALLTVSRSLLAAIVDDLFGAGGMQARVRQNDLDFSGMERRIGMKFGQMAAQSLKDAFSPQLEFTPTVTGTESHTALVSVADSAEPFCVMAARLTLATGGGLVSAAIPYRALEPYRTALSSVISIAGKHDSEKAWEDQIDAALGEVPVELAAEAGVVSIPLSRLSHMQLGDVMALRLFKLARVVRPDGGVLCLADYGERDGEIHLRVQADGGP